MATAFVILSGKKPWFMASDGGGLAADPSPVGKGKGEKKAPSKTRASARGVPIVQYAIFEKASHLTDDPFWTQILKEMAYGKFPRGFRYINNVLTYKIRSKTLECIISQSNAQEALVSVITFMQQNAHILSIRDNEMRKREMKENNVEMEGLDIDSWSQIRTAPHRSILIGQYVRQLSRIMSLTSKDSKRLECTIRLGICGGHFNSKTIHVEHGRIKMIDGLVRTNDNHFDIDPAYRVKHKKSAKTRKTASNTESVSGATNTGVGSRLADMTGHSCSDDNTLETTYNETTGIRCTNISFYKSWVKFLNLLHKRMSKHPHIVIQPESPAIAPPPLPPPIPM